MAARIRKSRGSAGDTVQTNLRVDRNVRDRLYAIADATGYSTAQVFEEILKRVEVDAEGVPVWWELPAPDPDELPGINREAMLQAS